MKQIVFLILAVLAGLVVATLITVQFEKLGTYWYPLPKTNPSPLEYMQYMAASPILLHVLYILGYGLSVLVGGYVGGRLSPAQYRVRGVYLTGFTFILPVIVLIISVPRPIWAIVSILVIMVVFTVLSALIIEKLFPKPQKNVT